MSSISGIGPSAGYPAYRPQPTNPSPESAPQYQAQADVPAAENAAAETVVAQNAVNPVPVQPALITTGYGMGGNVDYLA